MSDLVREKLLEGLGVMELAARDSALHTALTQAAAATVSALKAGNKLMIAGNGGSAADAQHVAAEFVCRLADDRPAMRAVALTTNTSTLTAVSNDYGFERVFARQIEASVAMCSLASQLREIPPTCCGRSSSAVNLVSPRSA
jgi:D-sedoheptulose 7-phosphate isomerase